MESKNAFEQVGESDQRFHVQVTIMHLHGCIHIYTSADSNIVKYKVYGDCIQLNFTFISVLLIVMCYFKCTKSFFFLIIYVDFLFYLANDLYKKM